MGVAFKIANSFRLCVLKELSYKVHYLIMPELPEVESIRRQLKLACRSLCYRINSHPSDKFIAAREIVGLGFEAVLGAVNISFYSG